MRHFRLIVLTGVMAAAAALAAAQEAVPTLTLDDAIRLALQRNRSLKVVSFGRGISRANLLVARGQFDPALVANRSSSESRVGGFGRIQMDDIRSDTYGVGLQGLTPIGTIYSLTANTTDSRDFFSGYTRTYQTFGGFTVTQPLLRGFGFDANLAAVRVAKADRGISDWAYRQAAIDTVTNVVLAYSNLELAHDLLNAARRSRDLAASLLVANEKGFKVGFYSQSDVITSRSFVASRDDSILNSERLVRDRQNQLRELIGDDIFFEEEPLFILAPEPVPDVTVSLRADLDKAFLLRPDYQEARLGIAKNRATEAAARNSLLPEVYFVGGYGYNGLAFTFPVSRQMVRDRQNPSYSAGVAVTIPITFAVGRGKARSARLQREQAEEELRRLHADIAVSVAAAAGQIETTRKRVIADRAAYELEKQALDFEQKKKLVGTSTTLAVVQQQDFVTAGETNVSLALASERQAVAIYDRELGTTLERYHINLTPE